MKRFGLVAFLLCTLPLAFIGRADAVSEFCPAQVSRWHAVAAQGSPAGATGSGALYAVKFGAVSPRTLDADLVFQTDSGWFEATVTGVQMERNVAALGFSNSPAYVVSFSSQYEYVRLPSAAVVYRVWVGSALVSDDGGFGWAGKGKIVCDPDPGNALDPHEASPPPDTKIALATTMAAPGSLDCAKPFAPAQVITTVTPPFPVAARETPGLDEYSSDVAIAVDAKGKVADAWPISRSAVPSMAFAAMDAAAVEAARQSTYAPATALCRAVPGIYIFRANFKRPE